jgi:hypothetical protein
MKSQNPPTHFSGEKAAVTELDDGFEPWPATGDPVRDAIGQLLVAIIENTSEGSSERARAMSEALGAHERIRDAMRVRPRLQ